MFIILFRDPIYNYRTTLLQYAINHVFFMKTFRITPKRTGKKRTNALLNTLTCMSLSN